MSKPQKGIITLDFRAYVRANSNKDDSKLDDNTIQEEPLSASEHVAPAEQITVKDLLAKMEAMN